MADHLSKAQRSWNMSRIKGRDTTPERTLRSLLHRAGFRFRLHDTKLPGRPDLVLPKYRAAVFVHGCFWHRHQGCKNAANPKTNVDFWQEKFRGTVERDRRNAAALTALGWRLIVVWECELKRNPESVTRQVAHRLQEVTHAS